MFYFKVQIGVLSGIFLFFSNALLVCAQGLGSSTGNSLEVNSSYGNVSNKFFNKQWIVRDENGTDWLTSRWHDGLAIDVSFQTPMVNTRTWWERDPYNNIQSWGDGTDAYLTLRAGNIGIGTINPTAKLTLYSSESGWGINSRANVVNKDQLNGIKFLNGYPNDVDKWAGVASVVENLHSNSTGLALYAGQTERLRVSSEGNVGIGVSAPNEKLSVNGNIRAKEIKVEVANWPDYVFSEEYKLPALTEVGEYIKVHGHLPEVPKAETVDSEGVSLGEMNKILLKKIEELTLYLIEKEKRMQKIEAELKLLKQ